MSDTPTPTEKKTFEQFLAAVPEAPSSSKEPAKAEEAPAADDPKAEAGAGTPANLAPSATPSETHSAASAVDLDPAQLRKALAAGDLDAVAEALGEDPALYSEKSTKWAAARRKEAKLKAERDRVAQQAESIVTKTKPVFELSEKVQAGEFTKFVELAEYLTGMDYDALVLKVARARHGSDPQVEVLKKRVAELEPVAAERAAERTTAAERALHETLRDELAPDHKVRAFEGWEAKVAAVLRESMDEDLGEPTLSPRQAADRVVRREREEYERRAKVFGAAPAPAKPRAKTPERAEGAAGANKRKLSRDEWLAAQK